MNVETTNYLATLTHQIVGQNIIEAEISRLIESIIILNPGNNNEKVFYTLLMEEIIDKLCKSISCLNKFVPKKTICNFKDINIYMAGSELDARVQRINRIIGYLYPSRGNSTVNKICRYTINNIDKAIKLDDISKALFLNKKYISTLFHETAGVKYSDYVKIVRMERAKVLLCEDAKKVYETAQLLGYRNEEYFSKVFKNQCGQNPSVYKWSPMDDIFAVKGTIGNVVSVAQNKEIRIGIIGSYVSRLGFTNKDNIAIYQMCADDFNEQGGIDGRKVRLFVRDYKESPETAGHLAEELITKEKVDVIMGGFYSSAREKIRPVVDEYGIPYFYDTVYEGGVADHYTFITGSNPDQNIIPAIRYFIDQGAKRFFILAVDYNYGILSADYAKYWIEKLGGEVIALEYASIDKEDFTVTIENIKEKKPDVVFLQVTGSRNLHFFSNWHSLTDSKIPVITNSPITELYAHKFLPEKQLENVYFSAIYMQELETQESLNFHKWIKKHKININYLGTDQVSAYLSMQFYKSAVERCHSTEANAVIDTLENENIEVIGPGGSVTINSDDHHIISNSYLFRVDKFNHINLIKKIKNVRSNFVRDAMKKQYGVDHGLLSLRKNSPNIQYNHMFYKV